MESIGTALKDHQYVCVFSSLARYQSKEKIEQRKIAVIYDR